MRRLIPTAAAMAILALTPAIYADVVVLEPNPADLYDLAHQKYYTWGMDFGSNAGLLRFSRAVLKFDDIRNWKKEPNVLYVHLLDWVPKGVRVHTDSQGGGDNFAGQGVELVTYHNLGTRPRDLKYVFDAFELSKLNEFIQNDGRVGLGFDPDCHFWNDGVSLKLYYQVIPEPACITLLIMGAGMLLLKRLRNRGAALGR